MEDRSGLTGGSVSNNSHWADDIVVPFVGLAALLDGEEVVFLLIVEDVVWTFIPGHVLHERCCDVPELEAIVLGGG